MTAALPSSPPTEPDAGPDRIETAGPDPGADTPTNTVGAVVAACADRRWARARMAWLQARLRDPAGTPPQRWNHCREIIELAAGTRLHPDDAVALGRWLGGAPADAPALSGAFGPILWGWIIALAAERARVVEDTPFPTPVWTYDFHVPPHGAPTTFHADVPPLAAAVHRTLRADGRAVMAADVARSCLLAFWAARARSTEAGAAMVPDAEADVMGLALMTLALEAGAGRVPPVPRAVRPAAERALVARLGRAFSSDSARSFLRGTQEFWDRYRPPYTDTWALPPVRSQQEEVHAGGRTE